MSDAIVAAFDFSDCAKVRIAGSDRERFLNGQLTNDVRKTAAGKTVEACVLNAKGRMNAHVFLSATAECFWIDADQRLRETLAPRLERYVIADDVEITDVTDEFALFHLIGPDTPALAGATNVLRSDRFGIEGTDMWFRSADHRRAAEAIAAAVPLWDAARVEAFRIERGIGRWGREFSDEIIPPEANLATRAIDYAKGCYIGQEVISRMKMSGQTNKRLCGLVSLSGAPIVPGSILSAAEGEQKEVGRVTSATRSEQSKKEIALGFVKRGFNEIGARLFAVSRDNVAVALEVVSLPFESLR